MASVESLDVRVLKLENEVAQITGNSVTIPNLSATSRKALENAVYPVLNGYRNKKGVNNVDYSAWEVDDEVMHIDKAGKSQILGMVIQVPFDPTADLENRTKFDMYQKNSPLL